ncbi:MAG: FHA domain-containing protein [Deltaproteobacteria bacterium]|nr:FHA domain-containing protein [Deltaproteobacteria bacterium]
MSIQFVDILVCPKCKGKLSQVEGGLGFLCRRCQLKFPVKEGIPVMLVDEALDMRGEGATKSVPSAAAQKSLDPSSTRAFQHRALFKVLSGPDQEKKFELELGTCRALGRELSDVATKTKILSVDWAISLDEETKGLILQYISRQFQKPGLTKEETTTSGRLGGFRRGPDIVFKDHALSRLHAMVFFDDIGVGILDLVSKNGTFVNGQEIESCLLKKGDTIELGETKIVFER